MTRQDTAKAGIRTPRQPLGQRVRTSLLRFETSRLTEELLHAIVSP